MAFTTAQGSRVECDPLRSGERHFFLENRMDEKSLPEIETTDASATADATPVAAAAETPAVHRRDFLKRAGATSLAVGIMSLVPDAVRHAAWAAGSDAPEKKEIKIGFIPLTDCASVVMASVMEFDKKYGIKIIPTKEASRPISTSPCAAAPTTPTRKPEK